jgi:Na+-translocating ferredoxin:NAD+ oxidoreductase RnfG subunit
VSIVDGILIVFILIIAVLSMAGVDSSTKKHIDKPDEEANLKRLRQMAEWDRWKDKK